MYLCFLCSLIFAEKKNGHHAGHGVAAGIFLKHHLCICVIVFIRNCQRSRQGSNVNEPQTSNNRQCHEGQYLYFLCAHFLFAVPIMYYLNCACTVLVLELGPAMARCEPICGRNNSQLLPNFSPPQSVNLPLYTLESRIHHRDL